MILSATHVVKNQYNETYNHLEKYYITKSDRVYGRGEIYLEKPNTVDCEIRHAYTVHSIQGETASGKLFIDLNGMFENRMLYTAISRAKKHEQIFLIY
jgi:ATP-dependent exoDNAse (exonuclease V) alpha subunit